MSVTRRSVLAASAAAPVVGALAAPATAHAASADTRAGSVVGRRTVDLSDGWRFALVSRDGGAESGGAYADAEQPGFDDGDWRMVAVPHDWSIEQTPTTEHGTTSGTGFLPGGLGWYRKKFTVPKAYAGKRISVEFDGVYMDSTLYVNGERVASHPYGYTGFAHDITDLLHTDGATSNVLAVEVRNQLPSSRWYSGSGIYRHARLVVTEPVHVRRWGTFVTTPDLAETLKRGYATVDVRTTVAGDGDAARDVTVLSTVWDAKGRRVARTESTLAAVGGDGRTDHVQLRLTEPQLWSIDTPENRYTLVTDLRVDGRTVDTYRTRFGVRHATFDPDDGFSLNGTHTKIKGVDLHHDLGALGAAVQADAVRRQLTIMKSMGVNALRTSHNPPAPEVVEACEDLGLIMLVEAFDCWRSGKNTYDYGRFFDAHSDADIAEMVRAARNSPAVLMWSIGNEIPDSTRTEGIAMAERLIADVKALDGTRPIVIGSDKYRSLPAVGSPADKIVAGLDGLGLNYNTAASVDALHKRYPHLFLFESESSSETSSRGTYQEPQHLNTGENHTPGKRATSSYDNNLASWTMSGEYGLKKDRDRRFFAGEFLWSGIDYIGEPTPYDVFPVKASFFGAVDTAGFPKDMYHLFRSQWSDEPMVHLLPMDWTTYEAGEEVEVWAYANVAEVELFLNGRSLGVRRFDEKKTVDGRTYLETTEATHDDKTVTSGPYPGSYTSPNGSAGKLHLTWQVPYAAGELKAVARRGGKTVATDVLRTAGDPHAIRLTPDRKAVAADGRALAFVTAEVVDAKGLVVPDAATLLEFDVRGGQLAGVDNGQQESAERYQASTRTTFHGLALAIVRAGTDPGALTVTARAKGLRTGTATLRVTGPAGAPVTPAGPFAPDPGPGVIKYPHADASYSGAPTTLPAALLDGDPATQWSNAFQKSATALLPAFNGARPEDWISVEWAEVRTVGRVEASFTVDARHSLPAKITVAAWDGEAYADVPDVDIAWSGTSGSPTVITFDAVRTTRIRLTLTSRKPGAVEGAVGISALEVAQE
ncbi:MULTISPECIES: glycoside hydrolase family 2 TIM barrel-domain containing protein [unclassified Streptomyces]|uniref:glycoside hydrolase family 2 TIM barrel-domain containing protein n=1 Tax=unclassified Streptomyces TaxID=2593676 RepID=UPI00278C8043|nr:MULTISPECIES: glycoside hydrolase family 2 TIM barrel-domain containing protein [unclassified Streptomyces]